MILLKMLNSGRDDGRKQEGQNVPGKGEKAYSNAFLAVQKRVQAKKTRLQTKRKEPPRRKKCAPERFKTKV